MANQTQDKSNELLSKNASATTTPAYRAELKTEPAEVKADESVTLAIPIKDAKGDVVRDLQSVHEWPIHVLVVSADLEEFYHLHPVQEADGSFRTAHIFPQSGNYRLYVDYTPPSTNQQVDQLNLKVSGKARPAVALLEDESTMKTVNGLRVTMKPNKPLRAGEELMLDFTLANEQTNQPISDLQPYLGALAHFVIISSDGTEFLHAHPVEKTETPAAHGASHKAMSHTHAEEMTINSSHSPQTSASQVSAHTTFPRTGLYKVWAQFQRGGQIITVPFVVRVADDEALTNLKT